MHRITTWLRSTPCSVLEEELGIPMPVELHTS